MMMNLKGYNNTLQSNMGLLVDYIYIDIYIRIYKHTSMHGTDLSRE
jgi:hypothetical protein